MCLQGERAERLPIASSAMMMMMMMTMMLVRENWR
jgi:hypothetical protein